VSTHVVVESLVRDRTLIVQFSSGLADKSRTVIAYSILQADGERLPGWLSRAAPDMLIGERPADVTSIALRIKVIYSDGTIETKTLEIDTHTGAMKLLPDKGALNVVPFHKQFSVLTEADDATIDALAELLKAG